MNCKICNQKTDNVRKLSKHIRDQHKDVDVKYYYDEYLKTKDEGKCVICFNETRYINLGSGYNKTCCRSCSSKLFRMNLKKDVERNRIFTEKVKKNMVKKWRQREITDEKKKIFEKMKKTKKTTIDKMSMEERKAKFGWINKLTGEERKSFIQKNYWEILYFYWQNITDEEFKKINQKRMKTIIERQNSDYVKEITEKDVDLLDVKLKKLFDIK